MPRLKRQLIKGNMELHPVALYKYFDINFFDDKDVLFIGLADLHLSNHHGAGVVDKLGVNSFLKLRKQIALDAIEKAAHLNVPVVFAGDTIDTTSIDAVTAYAFHDIITAIRDQGVRAYFMSGNHEYDGIHNIIESYGGLNFSEIEFISRPSKIRHTVYDKYDNIKYYLQFYFIPYLGKGYKNTERAIKEYIQYANAENNYKNNVRVYKILVLHIPVIGMMYNVSMTIEKKIMPITTGVNLTKILAQYGNPFDMIIAGDIHERQFGDNINNFMYLGQPYWNEFAKKTGNKKGINIFYLSKNKKDVINVVLSIHPNAPKFISLNVKDINKTLKKLDNKSDSYFKGNIFKFSFEASIADNKQDNQIAMLVNYLYERGALKVISRKRSKKIATLEDLKPDKTMAAYYNMSTEETVTYYINKYFDSAELDSSLNPQELITIGTNILKEIEYAI